jgi:NAD(P)-dependent dehydrogenase (short-subunit alcohol dehydrogenase family)
MTESSTANGVLTDRVVIVTGASSGIGAEAAGLFAREGATVTLAARSEDRLVKVTDAIVGDGGVASYVVCDVSNSADVQNLVDTTVERYGRLDGAFNNGALSLGQAPLADLGEEELDQLLAVNVKGMWLTLRAEIRAMLAGGVRGSIVNMTSLAGVRGAPMMSTYAATKHAVVGLTRSAARDYGSSGLRINAIAPGAVDTEVILSWRESQPVMSQQLDAMTPLGRGAKPSEVAEAAAWLLSDRATYLTGAVITIDGGMSA